MTSLTEIYLYDNVLTDIPDDSVLIIVCLVIVIVIFTAVLLLHRYRWHIRLLLYEAFRGRGDRWRRLQADHFQYDVFVSYAEKDFHWVQQHLVPELEDRRGLKLCLHQRDFIPGKHIVDNIADCVESSKKVMMVFSSDFAKSPWCQFELTLCLTHVMDHDDALVITCLHDIPSRDLTPAMMAVMKTTTYRLRDTDANLEENAIYSSYT
nr:hypothetical protein BaRGS_029073 [Batillaria attramentaria]